MTPETAKNALAFLARVELKGAEVPALVAVAVALEQISIGQLIVCPPIESVTTEAAVSTSSASPSAS